MSYSLQGKTVLVTGAARGIGAEAARQIAARGARVALVGLEPEELDGVAKQCGNDALWFEADVTDYDAIAGAVEQTVEQAGGVDVVVANAGIGAGGPIRHVDRRVFERVVDVNLLGVFRTVHASLPHVIERRGYVLPIASVAAVIPSFPGFGAYSASKAGVEAMARCLRLEVGHLGVDVGVAYFSWIDTDLVRGAQERETFKRLRGELRGPLGKTYPVSDTGKAIVAGIEQRAKYVTVPDGIKRMIPFRGIATAFVERVSAGRVPEAMAVYEAEIQRDPTIMGAVGAGGEADARVSGVGTRG